MASQPSLHARSLELLASYYQHPTIAVRNQIVRLNTGLVRKIAHQLCHQCSEPYEDLEQIGFIGLIRAIERFNPNQGCAFSSFAVPYIRGEILHFLRDRANTVKLPRRWQDLQKDAQRVRENLSKQLGRQPRDAEIAAELGISLDEWRDVKLAGQNRSLLSLDATISQQADCTMTLGDMLPDVSYQALQNLEEERQQLQHALGQLEEKTRKVIEYVFFRNLSRKEVAEQIGVSPMTVTRWIQRGIDQMIAFLQSAELQTDP